MSKNSELKKAYRDLQLQEAPDLWNRIESNLMPKAVVEEETPKIIHAEKRKKKKNYRTEAGLAAAACCILLVFGGMMGRQKGADVTGAAETTAGSEMMVKGTADAVSPQPVSGDMSVSISYDSLALRGTDAPAPPEHAVYVPADHYYFTEADLKDAGLLSQVTVESVSYENDPDGRADSVVYDVVVDNVLYLEDYVSEAQKLQVKSPLVGSREDGMLYSLKEGGTYILPLKYENSAYWLVYPNAPQIEVTEDTKYLFHTGWQSLINDQTAIVLKNALSPEDYYYDRMVMRKDPVFLSNLTALMQVMHKTEGKG